MTIRSDPGLRSSGDIAPALAEPTDRVLFDGVWHDPALPPRARSLATVSTPAAPGRARQSPFHLRRALDNGVSPDELGAPATRPAFYAGWPATACAVTRQRDVVSEAGQS